MKLGTYSLRPKKLNFDMQPLQAFVEAHQRISKYFSIRYCYGHIHLGVKNILLLSTVKLD